MDKRLMEEALAGIKDPVVREHYRAQLEMQEEIAGERTGGIFDDAGVSESAHVALPLAVTEEGGTSNTILEETRRPRPKPGSALSALIVPVAFVVLAIVVAWWCSR
jgi:hypothetical protein